MVHARGVEVLLRSVADQMSDPENVLLARSILGTATAADITQSVAAFVRNHTGLQIENCCLCEISVSAVFGLRLEDGQRILLKVHGPRQRFDSLHAIYRVQSALEATGFPCPRVLVGPAPFGNGVVYDWDSLMLESELILVGVAAATFTATWYLPVRLTPTVDEAREFVGEYENACGVAFTAQERHQINGAATYARAYSARREHAIDPEGKRYAGGFREALAAATTHGYPGF